MNAVPTINHWIGQNSLIARFRVALEASWQDAQRLPHILLVGSGGLGKTELAHLAAREMAVNIHERLAQTLTSPGAVNGLLLAAEDKEIVFIDEIHELQPICQTTLYRAMEDGVVSVSSRGNQTHSMPLKNVTVIGATTDEYSLLPPLRDRFKLSLSFTHYEPEALARITAQRAALMGIPLEVDIAEKIGSRAKGIPRLAVRLLEACHRYTRSRGEDAITQEHFDKTVELEGLDALGLSPEEQRYLRYLSDRQEPTRLSTLESALGIHRRTLQEVVEPFLVRAGFIEKSDKGRSITTDGLRHIGVLTNARAAVS
jgi:holliday junction DNA helicase RuvB